MRILEGLVHMYLRHQREKVWEERRRDKMRDHDAKAARFPDPPVTWAEYRALIAAQKQAYGADGRQGIAPIGEGFIARVTCVSMSPERWLGEILVAGAYHPDIWAGGGQRDPDAIIKVFYQFPPIVHDRVVEISTEEGSTACPSDDGLSLPEKAVVLELPVSGCALSMSAPASKAARMSFATK